MQIQQVKAEDNLRKWLSGQVANWNLFHGDKVRHDWIEPAFGSSMGIPDCALQYQGQTWAIELKHWYRLRDGVQYKVRPVQRRYHHINYNAGKKCLIMATVVTASYNELVLIRGDNVPLRDYCVMQGSGCNQGIKQTIVPTVVEDRVFETVIATLVAPSWWE